MPVRTRKKNRLPPDFRVDPPAQQKKIKGGELRRPKSKAGKRKRKGNFTAHKLRKKNSFTGPPFPRVKGENRGQGEGAGKNKTRAKYSSRTPRALEQTEREGGTLKYLGVSRRQLGGDDGPEQTLNHSGQGGNGSKRDRPGH